MNRTTFDEATIKDNFAVAQVALYLFAILQVVILSLPAKNGSLAECVKLTQGGRKDG